MTNGRFRFQWLLNLLHWTARVLSLVVLGFVLLFFIGEGGFNLITISARESVMLFLFLMTCIGLIVAWQSETVGGAMAILSMALFYVANWIFSGHFPRGWAFAAVVLPALLFLLCNLLHAGNSHNQVEGHGGFLRRVE
jgi:hypothetical protein